MIGLAVLAIQGAHLSFPKGSQGAAAGDFRIVAYQGEAVLGGKESTFSKVFEQGKPVVLNFWAGDCPSCSVEMPGFQRVSSEFADKVIFVGLDVGPFTGLGTHDDAVRLARQLGIRYPLAYAVDASSLELYKVQGMPTTLFLNATGHVVERVTGTLTEAQLRSEIRQKLLAPTS
jgi:thiol-disulfide isomerase/thioredoxin